MVRQLIFGPLLTENTFGSISSDVQKVIDTEICKRCDLTSAKLDDLDLSKSDLEEADLTGIHFTGASLSKDFLFKKNLNGAHISDANWENINFSHVTRIGTKFSRSDISYIGF